jgi:hypothetical protein
MNLIVSEILIPDLNFNLKNYTNEKIIKQKLHFYLFTFDKCNSDYI